MRDQLAVCQFFAKKLEYQQQNPQKFKKKEVIGASSSKKKRNQQVADNDVFDETKDLFYEVNSADDSGDDSDDGSVDNYCTESAFHNDLESTMSLTEKSGKYVVLIYAEILRMIKPLEKQ